MSDVLKELLPCPFCGSDDIHTTSGRGTGFRQYHCNSCHAKGPVVDAVYDGDKSWNTRAQSDLTAQLTPPKDAGEHPDTKRLNFLDSLNAALNKHYGTKYLWKMITSHNVNRLMLPNFQVDLNDAVAHGLPSCRAAIDEKMREHEHSLAQANRKGGAE